MAKWITLLVALVVILGAASFVGRPQAFSAQAQAESLALSSGTSRLPYTSFVNVSGNPDILDTLPMVDTDPFGHVHIAWWGTHISPGAPDGVATDVFYSHGVNQTFSVPISIPIATGYYSKDTTSTMSH